MGNNKEQIILYVNESLQTKAFDETKIIHKKAFKRIKELIDLNLKKADKYNPENKEILIKNRIHNNLSINGERGAGKTSFMLSILDWYRNNYKYKNEIIVLDILDPTLISTKQHVFILLISMIEEKVNKKFSNKCINEKYYSKEYKEWKKSLEELAKGLNQLDGIGTNPYEQDLWDDSVLVMAKGLSMAKAGRELEWKFHKFVNKSLKVLSDGENEKKAFLLFIDDIDTDFSKGWDVLEVLRKYITTPQIITIIAGNFELYELLVSDNKIKLFENLIEFENKFDKSFNNINYYKKQVNELSQQYLIKVLPINNRVFLHNLYYYYSKNYDIFLEELEKNLKVFLRDLFKNMYGIVYDDYIKVITSLPLRTFFQWLYYAKKYENKKEEFFEISKEIFMINFLNFGITHDFFENLGNLEYSLDEFCFKFIHIFTLEDIKQFRPNHLEINKNIALMLIPQFLNLNNFLFYKLKFGIKVLLIFYIIEKYEKNYNLSTSSIDLISQLFIDKYLTVEERLKIIFNFILNNAYIDFNCVKQIYKTNNNFNLSLFKEYFLKKENKNNYEKFFEDFEKKYNEVTLNYNPFTFSQYNSDKIRYDLETFKKYLKNEIEKNESKKNESKKNEIEKNEINILLKKIETVIAEIKTYNDIEKSINFWHKIPFFKVKNITGNFIKVYVSPLKVISFFIKVLETFETEKESKNINKKLKEIIYEYSNLEKWYIISSEKEQIESKEKHQEKILKNEINNINESINDLIEKINEWYVNYKETISEFSEKFHIINSSEFYYNFYNKLESLKNCCLTVAEYLKVVLSIFINEIIKLYIDPDKVIREISTFNGVNRLEENIEKLDTKDKKYIEIFTSSPIFKFYLNIENNDLLNKMLFKDLND